MQNQEHRIEGIEKIQKITSLMNRKGKQKLLLQLCIEKIAFLQANVELS